MFDKITEDQYQELLDVYEERNPPKIVKAFQELMGIVVKPYTGYQFFNSAGDYIGDDNWNSIAEILEDAGIEVTDDGNWEADDLG